MCYSLDTEFKFKLHKMFRKPMKMKIFSPWPTIFTVNTVVNTVNTVGHVLTLVDFNMTTKNLLLG